jgi:hypothetical protein
MGSSGGTFNTSTAGTFVGLGSQNNTEASVQQVVPLTRTFTTFFCGLQAAPTANTTFTLRVNGANTGTACTVNTGATTGSVTSSYPVTAGNFISVAVVKSAGGNDNGRYATWGLN